MVGRQMWVRFNQAARDQNVGGVLERSRNEFGRIVLNYGETEIVKVTDNSNNDNILDRIMAMLNEAPFIIADFTGGSPGVYYEAGVAKGQKKLVIHSCRKDSFAEDVHFDLKHESFLLWGDPGELREGVCNRILADFVRGPYKTRSSTKPQPET